MESLFTPGCPCCAKELGAGGIPAAPSEPHRHSESDPKQSLRKELTQCQYCFKSKNSGITLQKCAGCLIDIYCSKECQKKAWPSHKLKCKLNQRSKELPLTDLHKTLCTFTTKHRPIIAESAIRALDLSVDPTRCTRDVLCIFLQTRPGSSRVETAFYASGADVVPIDSLGLPTEELKGQLRTANTEQKRLGMLGSVFVMLICTNQDQPLVNVAPVGFGMDVFLLKSGLPWKEQLLKNINEGIVQ